MAQNDKTGTAATPKGLKTPTAPATPPAATPPAATPPAATPPAATPVAKKELAPLQSACGMKFYRTKDGTQKQVCFPTLDEARKAAAERDDGPRQVFMLKHGGKEYPIVHCNIQHAVYDFALEHLGVECNPAGERSGRTGGGTKPQSVEALMAAIAQLPPAERDRVLAAYASAPAK